MICARIGGGTGNGETELFAPRDGAGNGLDAAIARASPEYITAIEGDALDVSSCARRFCR